MSTQTRDPTTRGPAPASAGAPPFRWRHPFGYLTAPGLFLVSALGGLAFAAAALFERLLAGVPPEFAVIAVHLAISAISGALLVPALRSRPTGAWRASDDKEVVP